MIQGRALNTISAHLCEVKLALMSSSDVKLMCEQNKCQPIDPRIPMVREGESPLKAIRDALGCTQEQFAARIGVTSMTISRWERGVAPPTLTIPQIKALSRELKTIGMTIDNLPDSFAPTETT